MICLTGDIHHASLKINEQSFIADRGDSEVKIAARYLRLVEELGIKVTFYTTGKTLAEEWEDYRPIAESQFVEIGGHTYGGLPRGILSRLQAGLTGRPTASHSSSHGSYHRQLRDVRKMIAIVQCRTGRRIVTWRSHGLVADRNTSRILRLCGIRCISDGLSWDKLHPETIEEGLISHPINVIMDHDHIYHAHRTQAYVQRQKRSWRFTADPTRQSYSIEEWGALVERQVTDIEQKGGLATVLMHPLCMFIADGFKTACRLLELFSRYQTVWASEVSAYLRKNG